MKILAIWALAILLGAVMIRSGKFLQAGRILVSAGAILGFGTAALVAALMEYLVSRRPQYTVLSSIFCLICCAAVVMAVWKKLSRKRLRILAAGAGFCLAAAGIMAAADFYDRNIPTVAEGGTLDQYQPYAEDCRLVGLSEPPSLTISEQLPVLDGATALYPVYAAFARAVYPAETLEAHNCKEVLRCSTTSWAYKALADREADIIFAAAPSQEQMEYADSQGVKLVMTPIGREAFVFFVNSRNPLENITVQEIRDIYSGRTTSWRTLGVNMGRIKAFQRDKGSGSQTMLERLMGNDPLAAAPQEDVVDMMAGIIELTADYKNYRNAIGFSFRFYSTEMIKNSQIKLLSVEGVYPSVDHIAAGTYPLASDFYAVTLEDNENPNTKRFLEWVLSEQGQYIVRETGYVPKG